MYEKYEEFVLSILLINIIQDSYSSEITFKAVTARGEACHHQPVGSGRGTRREESGVKESLKCGGRGTSLASHGLHGLASREVDMSESDNNVVGAWRDEFQQRTAAGLSGQSPALQDTASLDASLSRRPSAASSARWCPRLDASTAHRSTLPAPARLNINLLGGGCGSDPFLSLSHACRRSQEQLFHAKVAGEGNARPA